MVVQDRIESVAVAIPATSTGTCSLESPRLAALPPRRLAGLGRLWLPLKDSRK